jgi:hypothetical protein
MIKTVAIVLAADDCRECMFCRAPVEDTYGPAFSSCKHPIGKDLPFLSERSRDDRGARYSMVSAPIKPSLGTRCPLLDYPVCISGGVQSKRTRDE